MSEFEVKDSDFVVFGNNEHTYIKSWLPEGKPKATVVFIHGFGEHINRYNYMFNKFVERGIAVHSFDQTGHGNTGKRNQNFGYGKGFDRLIHDCDHLIDRVYQEDTPTFLMGHSWGGASALNYSAIGRNKDKLLAVLVSSPCLKVHKDTAPSFITVEAIKLLSYFYPTMPYNLNLASEKLTNDPDQVKIHSKDDLNLKAATIKELSDLINEGQNMLNYRYRSIAVKNLFIVHGDKDQVTDYSATLELVKNLKSRNNVPNFEFQPIKGGFHEVHNDLEKDNLISMYLEWIDSVLAKNLTPSSAP